jgi:thiamine biosynthesis lipoprotein ApbE
LVVSNGLFFGETKEFAHHIIDASRGESARGILTAVVVAASATDADVLATALVADARLALPALTRCAAEALLQYEDGRWEMTPGMGRYLR